MLVLSRDARGLAAVTLATCWQAGGAVFLARSSGPQSALRIALLAFTIAGLLSWLPVVCSQAGRGRRKDPALEGRLVARGVLVVVTTVAFLAFYAALARIPVEAASAAEVAAGVVVVLAFTRPGRSRAREARGQRIVALSTVLVCAIAVGVALRGLPPGEGDYGAIGFGLAIALIAGACGGAIVLLSAASGSDGVPASQLARERFTGAALVAGFVVLVTGSAAGVSATTWRGEAIVGALTIALPILLLQWGLVRAEPVRSELVLATLPALVHLGDAVWQRRWDPLLGGTMGLLVVTVAVSQFVPACRTGRRGGATA